MKNTQEKMYFEDVEGDFCYPLENHLSAAKANGLKEVTLVEAIPTNDTTIGVWCNEFGACIEYSECSKSFCHHYTSSSGRGKCKHKGQLYVYGEEKTFTL